MFKNRLVRITLVAVFLLSLMFGAMHLYQPMPTPDNEHPTAPLGMQVDEAEAMHLDTHRQVLSRDNDDVTVTWTEIDLSSYIPKGTEHVHLGLQIKEDDECANQSYLIVREKNDSESPWYLHPAVGTDPDADTDTGTTLDDYWVYNDVTVGVDKDGKIEYYILVGSGCQVDTRINLWGWDAPVEPVVNVKSYGAKGDGSTPDQQAFLDAIADVEDGGVLYIPVGTYVLQSWLSITNKSMTIRGEGPEKTVLQFSYSDGIVVSTNATDKIVEIRDLSLETDNAGTYAAIKLQGQDVGSNSEPQFYVSNVAIRPRVYNWSEQNHDYWATGIELYEGWDTKIDHVYIGGQLNRIESGTKGIRMRSQTVNVTVHDAHIFFVDKAISIEDNCQGIFIQDLIAVYVNWGVYANLNCFCQTKMTPFDNRK